MSASAARALQFDQQAEPDSSNVSKSIDDDARTGASIRRARTLGAEARSGANAALAQVPAVPLAPSDPQRERLPRAKTLRRDRHEPGILPVQPRPFVKWAGGKRQLLSQLVSQTPERFGAYHEPFVGGGALFYELAPRVAFLSDANDRLIRTYRAIRDDVESVIRLLQTYPHDAEFFAKMRRVDIDVQSDAQVAAWFIYLNKTAFNGLYRVNRANQFNVPFGDLKNPCICDEVNLRACSKRLQGVQIATEDFSVVLDRAKPGDFVYFDPPYMPISESSSFVSYTKGGFGPTEHERLRDVAVRLKRRGVFVLVSNSAHPFVLSLYEKDFRIEHVMASRAINSRADRRGQIREYLIS